jgi:hypothetical protein
MLPSPPTDADVSAADAALQRFNMADRLPADGCTKLHAMAAAGLVPQIKELLAHFVNPNAANKAGSRPLHVVSSADAARALLEGGAGVNARDVMGRTPLVAAAHDDVRAVLRAAGGIFVLNARSTARVMSGNGKSVRALAVFPDGRLASGSDDKMVRHTRSRVGTCAAAHVGMCAAARAS